MYIPLVFPLLDLGKSGRFLSLDFVDLSGSYLGSEGNFRYLQMPFFGRQVTIWAEGAKPALVSEILLELGYCRALKVAKRP